MFTVKEEQSWGLKGAQVTKINKNLHCCFESERLRMICTLLCLFLVNMLLSYWTASNPLFMFGRMLGTKKKKEKKKICSSVLIFSTLRSTHQICHGGQNQLCEWMQVLLRNTSGSKPHSCCSSYGSQDSMWHGLISVQIRFNILLKWGFHARLCIHLCCSLNLLQRVSHSLSVMYVFLFIYFFM